MPFVAIWTTLGLQRAAEAQASSTPLVFTEMAVGDGGGSPITPNASMTELVNETERVAVNSVSIAPTAPTTVRVEGLIPADSGGYTIREVGLFNADSELLAVASFPDTYKPLTSEGVTDQTYVRILLVYENASEAIALTIDTSVVMATRLYVDERIRALNEVLWGIDSAVTTNGRIADYGHWTLAIVGALSALQTTAAEASFQYPSPSVRTTIDGSSGDLVSLYTTRALMVVDDGIAFVAEADITMLEEANTSHFFGLVETADVGDPIASDVRIGFLKTGGSANWFAETLSTSYVDASEDTGVAASAFPIRQRLRIEVYGPDGDSDSLVKFFINGAQVAEHEGAAPASGTRLHLAIASKRTGASISPSQLYCGRVGADWRVGLENY